MSDDFTTGASLASIPSGSTVAAKDLTAHGGTGKAQKIWLLSGTYVCTGSDVNISVGTSVVKSASGLTIPSNTTHMLLTVETQDVRMREDGTSPTATNGVLLSAGTMIELPIPSTPTDLAFISTSATVVAKLNFSYRSYR